MEAATHEPVDSRVHHAILKHLIETGHSSSVEELAKTLDTPVREIRRSLERLELNHGLVLHPNTHDVWVVHPFSFVPTLFWISPAEPRDDDHGWWAPCIWCALGVAALLKGSADVHTTFGGGNKSVTIRLRDHEFAEGDGKYLAHFPIRAQDAWNNVHRFCGNTLVFENEQSIETWCAAHGMPKGDVKTLRQVYDLARAWYGDHLSPNWIKVSPADARAILELTGFTGPTWEIPVTEYESF